MNKKANMSITMAIGLILALVVLALLIYKLVVGFGSFESTSDCQNQGGHCTSVCHSSEMQSVFECEEKGKLCCIDPEKLYGDKEDEIYIVKVTNTLNVRSQPQVTEGEDESNIIGSLASGSEVVVIQKELGDNKKWYQIDYTVEGEKKAGYVHSDYLKLKEEE